MDNQNVCKDFFNRIIVPYDKLALQLVYSCFTDASLAKHHELNQCDSLKT